MTATSRPAEDSADVKTDTYQIESSKQLCTTCAAEIPCGHSYYSAVRLDEETFRRHDFCLACWRRVRPQGTEAPSRSGPGPEPAPAGEFFAYWRTQRPAPLPGGRPRLRFEPQVVLDFFRRLPQRTPRAAAEGPAAEAAVGEGAAGDEAAEGALPAPARADLPAAQRDLRFVLALLLVRKKLLSFLSSAESGGREWLQLAEREDPSRIWWVENPQLHDSELERVREGLADLLHMDI